MTAYYDTLIVTFSDPIRILDMMCTDTCDVATLKEWIESYESTRMTPINEHTAVITSEYNMVHVVEWLRKYTPIAEMIRILKVWRYTIPPTPETDNP